jgi:murein DD-endopeptidase MepM/ murein hydrolase activator NlpD
MSKLVAAVAGLALLGACSSPSSSAVSGSAPEPVHVGATQSLGTPASPARPAVRPPRPVPTVKTRLTYAFPVVGKSSYGRSHHDYPATDVMTRCGNTFVAVTSGTVLAVSRKDTWSRKVNAGATRGGLSVSILGDDGVRYYGSHLSVIGSAIKPGVRVRTGQTLARTGDTGDASACHVHFGISPPCARVGDWFNQRGTVWPWSFLDSWRKGGQKSAVATVKAWQKKNGCPTKARADA